MSHFLDDDPRLPQIPERDWHEHDQMTPDLPHEDDRPAQVDFVEQFLDRFEIVVRPRLDAPGGVTPTGAPPPFAHPPAPPAPAQIIPPPPPPVALEPPAVPHPDPLPGIIPAGSVCTISGASGVGKTALLAGWVKAWQDGTAICGHQVGHVPAIGMISTDRPWRDHQGWFDKAGCEPIRHYSLHDDDAFNWDQLRDWRSVPAVFAQHVDRLELPPGSLLIVDPLPLYVAGRLIDYKDAAIGMAHIGRVIRARQLTLLGVFHVAKEKGNKAANYLRPQDRILGSGGQIGYSETAIYLMAPDESGQDYYQVGWVPHQRPAESFRLERDHQGLFLEVDTLAATEKELREVDTVAALVAPGVTHLATALVPLIMDRVRCQERKAKKLLSQACHYKRLVRIGRGAYRRAETPIPAESESSTQAQ